MIVFTLMMARCHNAIYSVMVENTNAICSVVRNAAQYYNRGMTSKLKMTSRAKILAAIQALPTREAREMWAKKLSNVLYEMQK